MPLPPSPRTRCAGITASQADCSGEVGGTRSAVASPASAQDLAHESGVCVLVDEDVLSRHPPSSQQWPAPAERPRKTTATERPPSTSRTTRPYRIADLSEPRGGRSSGAVESRSITWLTARPPAPSFCAPVCQRHFVRCNDAWRFRRRGLYRSRLHSMPHQVDPWIWACSAGTLDLLADRVGQHRAPRKRFSLAPPM